MELVKINKIMERCWLNLVLYNTSSSAPNILQCASIINKHISKVNNYKLCSPH